MKFNLKLVPEPLVVLQSLSDVAAAIYTGSDLLHMQEGPEMSEIIETSCTLWRVHDALAEALQKRGGRY